MASLQRTNSTHRIQFNVAGKRRTLRLGKLNDKTARKVLSMIDQMEDELALTGRLSIESLAWATAQPLAMRTRLAGCGLIPVQQQSVRVSVLLSKFEADRHTKDSTATAYGHALRNLAECYGPNTPVDEVTDAAKFEQHLKAAELARATIGRRIKAARTIWSWAMKHQYVNDNPFKTIAAPAQVNPERKAYVARDIIDTIIDDESDLEFRLILALARFAGLRCASEVLALEWSHVNWHAGTLTVPSPKTEHHHGGEQRVIPIFADVLPHLRAVFDATIPGTKHVIDRLRDVTPQVWTKRLVRHLKRIDVNRWPRLWQNLRASCATDLAKEYRLSVVSEWMGHGVLVGQDHYQMVTTTDIAHARGVVQKATYDGGAITPNPLLNRVYSTALQGDMGVKGPVSHKRALKKLARAAISDAQLRLQMQLAACYRRVTARAARRLTEGGAA
jgi:integrase